MKTQCDSSLIQEFEYDDASWVLSIRFRATGEVRNYGEFPPDLADDFIASDSKGKFFNAHIAKKFPVQKGELPVTVEAVVEKKPEQDFSAEMDRDIAALEAGWAKGAGGLPVAAVESVYSEVNASLFPDASPASTINGFDADVEMPTAVKTEPIAVAEPEILSPEQAVAVISPKSPKADALTAEAHRLAGIVIAVTDDTTYTKLHEHTVKLVTIRKALFDLIDPYREIAYRAYEAIQNLNKSRLGLPDTAIKENKAKLLAYESEQAAKRAEAQRLADLEAARRAEEERKRLEEELTLSQVNDALLDGDTALAENLFANPVQLPAAPAYASRVQEYAPPPVKGGSTRRNWKCEVKDKEALILDIAAGIAHFKKHGHLGPHAPDTFIEFNSTAMNSEARAKETKMVYPGVRVWNDAVKAIRG